MTKNMAIQIAVYIFKNYLDLNLHVNVGKKLSIEHIFDLLLLLVYIKYIYINITSSNLNLIVFREFFER